MIYPAVMRRSFSILAAGLVLLATSAAAASAQSGDQQYTDPFAGNGGSTKTHTTGQESSSGGSGADAPTPATPQPAPAQASTPAAGVPAATLPRTGFDVVPLAVFGALLLAAGAALIAASRPAGNGGR